MMSKLERLNARVAKLLTTAVHEVLEVVKETVSEYQEKTARTQRENESLKRRLRELQDNAGENPPLPGSSNNPSQDKTIKDEIASQDKTIKDETEEVDPETGSSSERFSLTLQEEMRGEGMIFTDSDTVDCSVSLGLVTNTDSTAHVAYWLPGDEHDVSVSPPCSQTLPPIKTEPEPGYLCSPDQVEQGDTFNCGGVASGVSQCDSSANNTENPGMADTVQYSNQWKRELDPANQDAASSSCLGSIDALSCEMPIRRKSLRLKKKRSKSEPFVQSDTGEEEPLDWGGSESLFGSTSDDPAEPEPSQPGCRLVQKAVGRPKLYCCSLCGRVLRDDRDFEKHQLVHSGEKPHSCTQCNKRFSQLSILKNHQCHHTGEKPHNCSVCGKNFSSSNYLKIHQRCHTGELPYSCDQCGKHFSDCSNFKKHMLIHL